MEDTFGLKPEVIAAIREVFATFPQLGQVIIYGSRAKGNYRDGSDIDLTLLPSAGSKLDLSVQFELEEQLEELMLPYLFDISILATIENPNLREHITRMGRVFYRQGS